MSGRGKSSKVVTEAPVVTEVPVEEVPKYVETLSQALATLTTEFSSLRKENDEFRKENEKLLKELEGFRKGNPTEKKPVERKPKDPNAPPREYDVFVKNKVAEFKLEHPGMKYMELRALANAEWKKHKETRSSESEESDN